MVAWVEVAAYIARRADKVGERKRNGRVRARDGGCGAGGGEHFARCICSAARAARACVAGGIRVWVREHAHVPRFCLFFLQGEEGSAGQRALFRRIWSQQFYR